MNAMKTYEIKDDATITIGGVDYSYEKGAVTPKDGAEESRLDKLVAFGFARVKTAKTERTSS